jgi:hypothetical protein
MGREIDRDKLHRAWKLWDVGDWDRLSVRADKNKCQDCQFRASCKSMLLSGLCPDMN